jgi:O-antigen/teichoic acid export membrane protein
MNKKQVSMSTSRGVQIQQPDSAIRRFFQHHGSTIVGQGLILGLGTLTGILSARMLGPTGRGEYAAIIIWPMALTNFITFGITHAIVFNLGQKAFRLSEIATSACVFAFVQGGLSIAVGLLLVPFTLTKQSHSIQHLGVIFVLFTPLLFLNAYTGNLFQGVQDLARFNVIRVAAPAAYLLALVTLYFSHIWSLAFVIFSQLGSYVFAVLFGIVLVGRALRPRWQWNPNSVPRLLNYGARIQGLSIATFINQRVDQLILSLLVPPRQLGLYAVAVTLSNLATVFPQATGVVTFSRGSGQDSDRAKGTIGVAFRASLLWLLIACGSLFVFSPILIRSVFGVAFEGSIAACKILAPGALMIGLNQVLYNGASAMGRPLLPSLAEGSSILVTAVGLYFLTPRYGYIGAAVVSTVAYTLSFLFMLVLAKRSLGISLRDLFFRTEPGPEAERAGA